MARAQIITHTDDMDTSPNPAVLDEATDALGFRFAIDGVVWQLDTTAQRIDDLRTFLAPYILAAEKVGKFRAEGPYLVTPPTVRADEDTQAIRAWAKDQGMNINDRGRIPTAILEAYANRAKWPTGGTIRPAAKPKPTPPDVMDVVPPKPSTTVSATGARTTSAASKAKTPTKKPAAKATVKKTSTGGRTTAKRAPAHPSFMAEADTATA